jgi:hypothetical protein
VGEFRERIRSCALPKPAGLFRQTPDDSRIYTVATQDREQDIIEAFLPQERSGAELAHVGRRPVMREQPVAQLSPLALWLVASHKRDVLTDLDVQPDMHSNMPVVQGHAPAESGSDAD